MSSQSSTDPDVQFRAVADACFSPLFVYLLLHIVITSWSAQLCAIIAILVISWNLSAGAQYV